MFSVAVNLDLTQHFQDVTDALLGGRLVPFLGAGVNLCDRTPGARFSPNNAQYLPSGNELAWFLADEFRYPTAPLCSAQDCKALTSAVTEQHAGSQAFRCHADSCGMIPPAPDLAKVSQYGVTRRGSGALYEKLGGIFRREYPMTSAHRFLSRMCVPAPRALKPEDRFPMIVTTNYDDLMERALAGIPFDLIYYDSAEDQRGQFWHVPPGNAGVPIPREKANEYQYPFLETRPVVLKMHGTIDAREDQNAGVVITEDDYIDYLASEALDKLLPPRLLGKLRRNHLLFLGYSLRDWNLRVFLRRIKRTPAQSYVSWAIVASTSEEEKQYLRDSARVDVKSCDLVQYLKGLSVELNSRQAYPDGFDVWS